MITVLVADDHPLVRGGLERLLERYDDVELLGACRYLLKDAAPEPLMSCIRAAARLIGAEEQGRLAS